jgi:hypothetical protein
VSIKLWSINRWLRWAGLRVFVQVGLAEPRKPTEIGILWAGLPGSARWKRWSK